MKVSIANKITLLIVGVFTYTSPMAQSMSITTTNVSYAVDTYSEIETKTTNTSAFKLNIVSKTRAYGLSATITAKTFNPSSTTFASVPLSLTFRSITGVTTTGQVTGIIPLVEYPSYAILATNATKTGNLTAVWTYDLALNSIGYTIPPGTYIYTVSIRYNDGTNIIDRTFDATIVVSNVLSLTLTQNSPASFSFSTSSQILNGLTINNMNTFQIRSNKLWTLAIKSFTTSFSNSGTYSTANVPPSILQASITSPATTITLSSSDQVLKTGSIGNTAVSGNTFNMNLKNTPGFSTGPGTYSITLYYTLSAQ